MIDIEIDPSAIIEGDDGARANAARFHVVQNRTREESEAYYRSLVEAIGAEAAFNAVVDVEWNKLKAAERREASERPLDLQE